MKNSKHTNKNKPQQIPFQEEVMQIADDRGIFMPISNLTEQKNSIKRIYSVVNFSKGTVRGFHLHKTEWKFFTILNGSAKFVAVNSKKTAEKFVFISSSRKPTLIIIPPDFANGWVSLEDNTILLAFSTSTFEESIEDDKRMDPYKWGDLWKVKAR